MARARLGGADAVAVTQAGLLELNSAAVPAPAGRAAEKAARGQREKWLRSEIYARWAKKGLLRTFKWWPPRRLQPNPRKIQCSKSTQYTDVPARRTDQFQ